MSIPRIPRHADFRKLAAAGAHVGGTVALDELPRVARELLDRGGAAAVELDFGIDEEGHRTVVGSVAAELTLQCQRCLGPMQVVLDCEVQLAMVWNEGEIATLPKRFDGIVVGEGLADLFDLVEDELLLALPFAPCHAQGECALQMAQAAASDTPEVEPERQAAENPFAVLARYRDRSH